MKALLDACVLFPTVMREALLGAAGAGLFTPLWSERILGEWQRATARLGPDAPGIAAVEIALMRDRWRDALVTDLPALDVHLPDPDDVHVLAAAVGGHADCLVTRNIRDFPLRVLGAHGLARSDPDGFLLRLWQEAPDAMASVAREVQARAEQISGRPQDLRGLFKRAGMPRLAKALTRG